MNKLTENVIIERALEYYCDNRGFCETKNGVSACFMGSCPNADETKRYHRKKDNGMYEYLYACLEDGVMDGTTAVGFLTKDEEFRDYVKTVALIQQVP